jgi:hypothetical protein
MADHADRAFRAKRRTDAINLRIAGVQWQAIAERCGYSSAATAAKDIARAADQAMVEQVHSADQYRYLNTLRLERLLVAVMPAATATVAQGGVNLGAVDSAVRIIDRISKLHGLDQATKFQVTSIDALDAAILELEGQAIAAAAKAESFVDADFYDEPPSLGAG